MDDYSESQVAHYKSVYTLDVPEQGTRVAMEMNGFTLKYWILPERRKGGKNTVRDLRRDGYKKIRILSRAREVGEPEPDSLLVRVDCTVKHAEVIAFNPDDFGFISGEDRQKILNCDLAIMNIQVRLQGLLLDLKGYSDQRVYYGGRDLKDNPLVFTSDYIQVNSCSKENKKSEDLGKV